MGEKGKAGKGWWGKKNGATSLTAKKAVDVANRIQYNGVVLSRFLAGFGGVTRLKLTQNRVCKRVQRRCSGSHIHRLACFSIYFLPEVI